MKSNWWTTILIFHFCMCLNLYCVIETLDLCTLKNKKKIQLKFKKFPLSSLTFTMLIWRLKEKKKWARFFFLWSTNLSFLVAKFRIREDFYTYLVMQDYIPSWFVKKIEFWHLILFIQFCIYIFCFNCHLFCCISCF